MIDLVIIHNDLPRVAREAPLVIRAILEAAGEEQQEQVSKASGAAAPALAGSWRVQRSLSGTRATIASSEFWAHFVERGTRAHGPRTTSLLRFREDGRDVYVRRVAGSPAHPFREQAVQQTRLRLPALVSTVLRAAGL